MDHDETRARADRRPLVAAAAVVVLVLAVGAWLLADGVGGGGDGEEERGPVPAEMTPSTLGPEQRAEAEVIECIGGLSPDPTATVPPAADCVAPQAASGDTGDG
jgi:hypothetical protein